MLDDPPEVLGACLKMLGYSLNSSDPAELKKAQAEAIAQKRLVRAYLNAEVRDQLVAGDVAAAQAWAVTAAQAIQAAPGKARVRVSVGGLRAIRGHDGDSAGEPPQEAAHRFLNYLLRPAVAAQIVMAVQTATANGAAHALLPPELRDNPVLYPPAATLARGEWFEPQSAASQRLRDRLWTEIKKARS